MNTHTHTHTHTHEREHGKSEAYAPNEVRLALHTCGCDCRHSITSLVVLRALKVMMVALVTVTDVGSTAHVRSRAVALATEMERSPHTVSEPVHCVAAGLIPLSGRKITSTMPVVSLKEPSKKRLAGMRST